jgi:membrane-bound metal-dependent hydrolase YbcI (DUF457 family)
MDPITTGIGGALIAKALPEERRGPLGVWVVTAAALFPDIDVLVTGVTGDPIFNLAIHRGFTHSFVGVIILAPLLALAFRALRLDKNFKRLLGLSALAMLWHIFTDAPTSWGTIIYWPFSWHRVAWDWVFIIDLVYTGLLLVPQLVAWMYLRREGKLWQAALWRGILLWLALTGLTHWALTAAARNLNEPLGLGVYLSVGGAFAAMLIAPSLGGWGFRQPRSAFARIGVTAFVLYVASLAGLHAVAFNRVEALAEEKGLAAESLAAVPQPFSPFRWSGLVLTSEGVYRNWFSLLDGAPEEFEFYPSASNEYVEKARHEPAAETYLWFARFPVARYHNSNGETGEEHVVEFADLRFGLPGRMDEETRVRFGFRVVFDGNGEVVESGFPRRR